MDRHQDIENPDHERLLLVRRKRARKQRLMANFLALSPRARFYLEGLDAKQVNNPVDLRKILALAEQRGTEALACALDDGRELNAFRAEHITNILAAQRHITPEPAALQLTPRADLLELEFELPEPDLSINDHQSNVNRP
jgi:hypothetical protein